MCFYIDSKHPNKRKAKKDINCYKILCKSWHSSIQGFQYVPGKTYSDDDALKCTRWYINEIHRGYHSYSSKKAALRVYNSIFIKNSRIIVKCIIPEGSDYYYNSQYHEYVSNKIKIIDIIE